jgi:hypothetical protein
MSQRQTSNTARNESRTFVHATPQNGILYEYRVGFYTKDGVETYSSYKTQFEYWDDNKSTRDTTLRVGASQPAPGVAGARPALTINTGITRPALNNIISDLRNNDLLSSFRDELENNKGRANDLTKAQVRRFNKTSGEWVDFGVVNPGLFVDNTPLNPGRGYTYEVTLLKTSVFELLRGVELPEKDTETLTNYSQKRGRFENSRTARTNTLPPDNERAIRNDGDRGPDPARVYREGATNNVRYVDFDYVVQKPTLNKIMVNSVGNEKLIVISGRITGNVSLVDSVHIYATLNGVKAIIGITHVLGGKRAFSYMDRKLSGIIGARDYSARLMYNDYTISDETPVVSFTQRNNLTLLEEQANGF